MAKNTLCWKCANATKSACEWMSYCGDVPGWVIQHIGGGITVISCPKYKSDGSQSRGFHLQCKHCGKIFNTPNKQKKYCTQKCRTEHAKLRREQD